MMYLAIDYGEKRIGLAIGTMFPKPFGVLKNEGNAEEISERISKICIEEKVEKIILGLPQYDNGEESKVANQIKSLGRIIEDKTGLDVIFEIENFTSLEAERQLKQMGVDFRHDKGKVDELAATLLLEQYIGHENE